MTDKIRLTQLLYWTASLRDDGFSIYPDTPEEAVQAPV